ncbi:MAG: M20/M25/M40 family metallo-hydrolase [Bacteroidota bacterium]
MRQSLSLIAFFVITIGVSAQDFQYAKEIVRVLASDEYFGRGYVHDGDKIAAEFIASEYEKLGLERFKKSYFQRFTTPVNTFPDKMELTLDGKKLLAGVDFLIDPGSPGISGNFETISLSIEDILDRRKLIQTLNNSVNKFIVMPHYSKFKYDKDEQQKIDETFRFLKYRPENPSQGSIFLTKNKLTWGGSTAQYGKPSFAVLDSLDRPIKSVKVDVNAKFIPNYKTQNVLGYLKGQTSDSTIFLVGHYDHLGMMGQDAVFSGANDNASGIAMLLSLAKYFKENTPKYDMVFVAFGGEELGLLGSRYFVENPLSDLSAIKFLLNFDISGTGDDGIQVVNGKVFKGDFDKLVAINESQKLLKQVKIRGEACNSDHCFFYGKDVPCFFIYTLGGIQAYHDIYDRSETLPLTEFEDYFSLMVAFIKQL